MRQHGRLLPRALERLNIKRGGVASALAAAAAMAIAISILPPPIYAAEKIVTPVINKSVAQQHKDGPQTWQSIADANAGEPITYQIKGTLPTNWEDFTTYQYEFHDRPDAALAVDASSVKIELVDESGSVKCDLTDGFVVAASSARGAEWTATTADLKAFAPNATAKDAVVLTYKATLDPAKAKPGTDNLYRNVAYLTYSSQPLMQNAVGRSKDAEANIVTWALSLTKVDSRNQDNKLAGAVFTVQAPDGCYLAQDGSHVSQPVEHETDADGVIRIDGIAGGTYTVTETCAPKGFAKYADPFHVTIDADLTAADPTLTVAVPESNASAKADPAKGIASLRVPNAPAKDGATVAAKHGPSVLGMPQTGDTSLNAAVAAVALGFICIVVALAIARRNKNQDRG